MKRPIVIVAFVGIAALAPAIASAQSSPRDAAATTVAAIERILVDAIARAEPSVVAISRTAPRQSPLIEQRLGDVFGELRQPVSNDAVSSIVGAGVIIDPAGLVLTQYLAVREGDQHTITTTEGNSYLASIRAADPRSGLAVLVIQPSKTSAADSFPPIRFADGATPRKGQFVIAIGNPIAIESDGQATASWGIVTNVARKAPTGTNFNDAPGPYDDYRTTLHHLGTMIQTDAKLGWSAGGGALVNLRGEMVGVTTTAATIAGHEQPAGYAIPTNAAIRRIINTLKEGREVEYGMMGIGFGPSPIEPAHGHRSRLSVAQVYAGGPAARAGLADGDVITRIGDQPVDDIDAVQLAISALPPGTTTTVAYERSGRPSTTPVTLAKLAVAGKTIATVRPDAWRGIRVDYATALDARALAQAISSGAFDAEGCVLVSEVEPESVAWHAGVRPGMFISHAAGKRVTTPAEFRAAAQNVGEELDIQLTQPLPAADPDAGAAQ